MVKLKPGGRKSLTASMKISVTDPNDLLRLRSKRMIRNWHRAWDWYDRIGEVHFALNEVGREMQRIELIAQKWNETTMAWEAAPATALASQAVAAIQSYNGGQGALLKSYYINSKVVGESLLVIYDKEGQTWFDMCSTDEISVEESQTGNTRVVRRTMPSIDRSGSLGSDVTEPEELPDDTDVIRFWTSHPRHSMLPDSPLLALELILEELDILTKSLKAKIQSRLVMAGIWKWPNTISDVSGSLPDGDPTGLTDDPNIRKVVYSMMKAIEFPDSPEAALPLIVKGPPEDLDKMVIDVYDRDVLETDIHLRNELLGRVTGGLDIHKETAEGTGDSNHWSAWAEMGSHLSAQVFPDVEALCNGLTKDYLNDQIAGESGKWRVWYCADALTTRPNQAEDFRQLSDRAALSDKSLRSAAGASEADAPTGAEKIRSIGLKIQNPYLSTFDLPEQADFDWTKVWPPKAAPGPGPDSPGDAPKEGPGTSDPGSPGKNESDAPKSKRPGG